MTAPYTPFASGWRKMPVLYPPECFGVDRRHLEYARWLVEHLRINEHYEDVSLLDWAQALR